MRHYFLLMILLIGITGSYAQVNRYDKAINYQYQSTYQSLDTDFIINMAIISKEIREAKKRSRELIDEVKSIYQSYPKYPNSIYDGWHEVVQINTSPERIFLIKVYTTKGYVTKVYVNEEVIDLDIDIPINKGKAITDLFTLYFLKDIKKYNMN